MVTIWSKTCTFAAATIMQYRNARWFFLKGVLPPPQARSKLFLFTPVLLDK